MYASSISCGLTEYNISPTLSLLDLSPPRATLSLIPFNVNPSCKKKNSYKAERRGGQAYMLYGRQPSAELAPLGLITESILSQMLSPLEQSVQVLLPLPSLALIYSSITLKEKVTALAQLMPSLLVARPI